MNKKRTPRVVHMSKRARLRFYLTGKVCPEDKYWSWGRPIQKPKEKK